MTRSILLGLALTVGIAFALIGYAVLMICWPLTTSIWTVLFLSTGLLVWGVSR